MIACLRSTRFMLPDRSASIFLELRRHHDTRAVADNKSFIVSRRTTFGTKVMHNKSFGTYREARRFWDAEAAMLYDGGYIGEEMRITGFHEEG